MFGMIPGFGLLTGPFIQLCESLPVLLPVLVFICLVLFLGGSKKCTEN